MGGIAVFEPRKPDQRDLFARTAQRFGPVHAVKRQAISHVLHHGAVRKQGKALEHHRHLTPPKSLQACRVIGQDIFAIDQDATTRGFNQAIEMPDQGAFARSRQPHDDKGFPRPDIKRDVMKRKDVVRLFLQARLVHTGADFGQRTSRIAAKHL